MKFEVDFNGVRDKQDIIRRLVLVFGLPEEFHLPNTSSTKYTWNWDAFFDYFTSLTSDSEIVRNSKVKPKKIHLIVKNINEVKKASQEDYKFLLSVLEDWTKEEYKDSDRGIECTYEIYH